MTSQSPSAPPASLTRAEPLALWRAPLSRALHRNRSQPFARYFQLATVKPDNTPANRTVVFRGFLSDTNDLMTISDRRSQKTDQIQQNLSAEICWYFTKTREQFRLSGQLTLVTADHPNTDLRKARQHLWQNISDNARLQFAWPQPKQPRETDQNNDAFNPPPPDEQTPLDTFSLLLLTPGRVDYLSLRGEPQTRRLYEKIASSKMPQKQNDPASSAESSSEWTVTTVNP